MAWSTIVFSLPNHCACVPSCCFILDLQIGAQWTQSKGKGKLGANQPSFVLHGRRKEGANWPAKKWSQHHLFPWLYLDMPFIRWVQRGQSNDHIYPRELEGELQCVCLYMPQRDRGGSPCLYVYAFVSVWVSEQKATRDKGEMDEVGDVHVHASLFVWRLCKDPSVILCVCVCAGKTFAEHVWLYIDPQIDIWTCEIQGHAHTQSANTDTLFHDIQHPGWILCRMPNRPRGDSC